MRPALRGDRDRGQKPSNMGKGLGLFLVVLLNISCTSPGDEHEEGPAEIAFVINEKDLIPEGITYDAETGRFFLGSKNKDKVIAIDANGGHTDFISTRQDSLLSTLGLKVDVERRRLWAVSNRVFGDRKVSAVHVFSAETGQLIERFFAPEDRQHHLNDLVLTDSGDAYVTDTQSSRIFWVPSDLSGLRLFMADSLINTPNGIALSQDNSLLFVESHFNGILLVDLNEGIATPIGNPMSLDTGGIDGLMYYRNSLIGIANSQHSEYDYIVRYQLSDDSREIIAAHIIDKANPAFNTPTTGVIVGDSLYVLAATCLTVFNSDQMDNEDLLENPVILKYKLRGF